MRSEGGVSFATMATDTRSLWRAAWRMVRACPYTHFHSPLTWQHDGWRSAWRTLAQDRAEGHRNALGTLRADIIEACAWRCLKR